MDVVLIALIDEAVALADAVGLAEVEEDEEWLAPAAPVGVTYAA